MPDHLSRNFPDEFRLDAGRDPDTQNRPICLVIPRILVSGNAARPYHRPRENGCQQNAAMKASVAEVAWKNASPSVAACDTNAPI
jgi:hypothetical protein